MIRQTRDIELRRADAEKPGATSPNQAGPACGRSRRRPAAGATTVQPPRRCWRVAPFQSPVIFPRPRRTKLLLSTTTSGNQKRGRCWCAHSREAVETSGSGNDKVRFTREWPAVAPGPKPVETGAASCQRPVSSCYQNRPETRGKPAAFGLGCRFDIDTPPCWASLSFLVSDGDRQPLNFHIRRNRCPRAEIFTSVADWAATGGTRGRSKARYTASIKQLEAIA